MSAFGRLLLVLVLLWLLLSGHFGPLLLSLGAISIVFILYLVRRMQIVDDESHPTGIFRTMFRYYPWLVKQIAISAMRVVRIIVKPGKPVRPTLAHVKPVHSSRVSRVILANSITLTPGTATLDASGDELLVHALTKEGAEGLQTGDMARRVPNIGEEDG